MYICNYVKTWRTTLKENYLFKGNRYMCKGGYSGKVVFATLAERDLLETERFAHEEQHLSFQKGLGGHQREQEDKICHPG